MSYRNEIFSGGESHYFTTTDEWERVKFAAMQRGRAERSRVAVTIVEWIIRHLRRTGQIGIRAAQEAGADLALRLNGASAVSDTR